MSELPTAVRVAYLGPDGTYTHAAALQLFGKETQWLPRVDIQEVFAAVESGDADYGVVPVENSSEGSVTTTLDCFIASPLQIVAELMLRIRHCLMAAKGTPIAQLAKVVAHQQALGQCRRWLDARMPGVERLAVSSNAEAARLAAMQIGVGAIAGRTAADLYGLAVLAESIEDSADNTTRFLLLACPVTTRPSGHDKTSLIIHAHNEPGTLFRALEPFHRFGINLTKLESRPSRETAWSYAFYVDFEGHADDEKVLSALQALRQNALDVKMLGSYPAAAGVL